MKLQSPAIDFRRKHGVMYAKSTADQRWYKVNGITKPLNRLKWNKKDSIGHNMINMDIYTRLVKDVNDNPDSSIEWVPDYLRNLNVPESKVSKFKEALLRLVKSKSLTLSNSRLLWDNSRMSIGIGVAVDMECKDVFNGKKNVCDVGLVSRLILTQLKALRLTPICAGLKVAGVPRPDRFSEPKSYTYHNRCTRGCKSLCDTWGLYTEVDLVAHDTVKDNVALLEVKTRNRDILDAVTLKRYNTQLWLTWVMFSLTYPSMAERSAAYLVIIRPGTNQVSIRSCSRPTISETIRKTFPLLTCFCSQVLNCLAPLCVNMRVETKLASSLESTISWLDPTDLCYRNTLFNQEKRMKVVQTVANQDE